MSTEAFILISTVFILVLLVIFLTVLITTSRRDSKEIDIMLKESIKSIERMTSKVKNDSR